MKILVYFLVYLGELWYTVLHYRGQLTLDIETKTAFLIAEVTVTWW